MKILVFGAINGDVDLINEYATKESADVALCVGNFGVHYRGYDSSLPDYIEGKKHFIVPTYVVRGVKDNISLCDLIIDKKLEIDNFHILKNGVSYYEGDFCFSGIGGSYSPKTYNKTKIIGSEKRHFIKSEVDLLKEFPSDILLMNDLIDQCNKNQILFSEETYKLFDSIRPKYCFVGKYDWWGLSKMSEIPMIFVVLPNIKKGYVIIDTIKWDSEAKRFDIEVENA